MQRLSMLAFGLIVALVCGWSLHATADEVPLTLTPQQIREDLICLRDTWAPLDKSFSAQQRQTLNAIVGDDIARADKLTAADLALEVSRAVAIPGNGHTSAWFPTAPVFHELPFEAYWFSDGLYIVRAHPDFAELLGARIEKLGPWTAEQAQVKVSPFISGTKQRIKARGPGFLRLLEVLGRIGATTDARKVDLTLRFRNGTTHLITMSAAPSADPNSTFTLFAADVKDRWPQVLDNLPKDQVPLTFRVPVDISTAWIGQRGNVFYLRSNSVIAFDEDWKKRATNS